LNYVELAAIAIFVVTLVLMIKRPRGLRLGYAAGIGAVASLLLGTVTLGQVAQSFLDIWDAALAFIGIVALSVTLDAIGFFKWAALRVIQHADGNGLKLYFYVAILTAAVSILFANDSAVLILTPIVLEIVTCSGISGGGRMAYLFSAGLIADTAAMPLITSNPINILSADFFHYSFVQHLIFMAPIAVATITSSILLVYLFFRKKIPRAYDALAVKQLDMGKNQMSPLLLRIIVVTLIAIDVGYVLTSLNRVPVSLVICSGAVFLIFVYWANKRKAGSVDNEKKSLFQLAKDINWDIILFMLSIFLVVEGLQNAGIVQLLASALLSASHLPFILGIFAPSMVITIGASFMNNWPMTILGLLSVKHAAATASLGSPAFTGLVFSNVIGNNLGPHFFPLGSLAILMWLEMMRRKGVKISIKDYLKIGAIVSIAEVAIASLVLWLEINAGFLL
jgi:arsenical pump membrane protein